MLTFTPFSSKSFMILTLTFRSWINVKLPFLYYVRQESKFILFMGISVVAAPRVKEIILSPIELVWHLCGNQLTIVILDFSSFLIWTVTAISSLGAVHQPHSISFSMLCSFLYLKIFPYFSFDFFLNTLIIEECVVLFPHICEFSKLSPFIDF